MLCCDWTELVYHSNFWYIRRQVAATSLCVKSWKYLCLTSEKENRENLYLFRRSKYLSKELYRVGIIKSSFIVASVCREASKVHFNNSLRYFLWIPIGVLNINKYYLDKQFRSFHTNIIYEEVPIRVIYMYNIISFWLLGYYFLPLYTSQLKAFAKFPFIQTTQTLKLSSYTLHTKCNDSQAHINSTTLREWARYHIDLQVNQSRIGYTQTWNIPIMAKKLFVSLFWLVSTRSGLLNF